jgi:diacylglycerol kinase (ATP)
VEGGRPSWDDYAVVFTRAAGHATGLATEAVEAGAGLVIAVGGDGTVNEVARALLGSDTALGIVPVGSGNGLARALRLPLKPALALATIERGVRRRIDVGRLNGGLFLNVAGTGFDAAVGAAFQRAGASGSRRGFLSYLRLCLVEVFGYRPKPLVLEAGGEALPLTPFMVTFANGPQYGSGAVINPGGKLDDGRVEIVYFDEGPILKILLAAPRLFTGGIGKASGYRRISTTHATLRADSSLVIHRDGDPAESARQIQVEVVPGALEVVVPATTASDPDGPLTPAA